MAHDPERRRFFGYINLFVAAMLLLVLADNYLGLYVGLGGRGPGLLPADRVLAATSPTAATAAKKAFIANRVGDIGLSLAIMLMFATFGRSSFAGVFGAAHGASRGVVTAHRAAAAARRVRQVRRNSRCSPGCSTRWRARPRCRR